MRQWRDRRGEDRRKKWSRNANAAKARKRMAWPAPDYPQELPIGSPMLIVRLDGWLVHQARRIALTSTRRSNVFEAHIEGVDGVWMMGGIDGIMREIGKRIARPLSKRNAEQT